MPPLITDHTYFQPLVEASPMPTAVYSGPDMMVSVANQAMINLWGKDGSVIGKTLREALPELEGQPFHALLAQVYSTGEAYIAKEDRADLVVNGRLQSFYFTFTYKPLKNAEGRTEAIINTATDVTELVFSRARVRETEERMSFALQSAGMGTWDLNLDTNEVIWDERCKELYGFSKNDVVGYQQVLKYMHPADVDRVNRAVQHALTPASGGVYDIKFRTIGAEDGQLRWLHCKGKAYFNANHQPYRFAGTALDVTAEAGARRRELQLLSLVERNADHMSIADMEGNLLYMNAAARLILGVAEDEDAAIYSARDFYTPQELQRVQQEVIPKIDPKTGWQGVVYLMNCKTKEVIPCHVNYILIKDPQTGEVIGRGATARDLRPELKAKAELQRLATLIDVSEDFCNYCDINGNTIYLNGSGSELIGLTQKQYYYKQLYEYHSESSNHLIANEVIPQLLETGKWSGPLELVHQVTGEIIPIHKQMFMIREDITNQPVAIAGIARDLRPEQNARKALDTKNAELSALVTELAFMTNSVPVIVWTSTPEGHIDYVNERWNQVSAISIEDSLGDRWVDVLHPDDRQNARDAWQHSVDTGLPFQTEYRCLEKSGNYRWYLVQALPLRGSEGHILKWYGTNTDIQEQKELARQKDNFLGVASHELKTPVTSLKAYAQVMETLFIRSGDTRNAAIVAKMDKQLNRLTSLIGDLLDVTKINTGRLEFHSSQYNFNQMLEEVVESVQLTTEKHDIQKQLKFYRQVQGDRERISQVITNLLTNAIKYSPDANRIVIYTEDHGHELQLCVQDFGIGISRDKKDRVFEQFYRVSGSKEHTFPGLGLGLYISSEIVKRMGGRIWVNSVEGKGSTFCFAIPVEAQIPA
jgi:PAS domain S-box-containing protein